MTLVVLGHGYSAAAIVEAARPRMSRIVATTRSADKARRFEGQGLIARLFGPDGFDPALLQDIASAEALLMSAAPDADGDPALKVFGDAIAAAPNLRWIGYLSTVGVYGDHGGAWVDEETPTRPVSARSRERVAAEEAWTALGARSGKAVHHFRLSGIYGPGRNQLLNLREGTARRIVKPGQVFNRIHVADIGGAVAASMAKPDTGGAIYNVTDDEPCGPQEPVAFGASLLGMEPPPEVPFVDASLSPMGRSFYGENKRVSNARLKERLAYAFRYPTYREGLTSLFEAGEGR